MFFPRRSYGLRRITYIRRDTSSLLLSMPETGEWWVSGVDVEVYGSLLLCLEKSIPLKGNIWLSLVFFPCWESNLFLNSL